MEGLPIWATISVSLLSGSIITKLLDKVVMSRLESKDSDIRERSQELKHIENLQGEVQSLWKRIREMQSEHQECQDQLIEMRMNQGRQDVDIEIMKRAVAHPPKPELEKG